LNFTILTLVLFLAACGGEAPASSGPIALTDGLGRTVNLPASARSVVSLTPSGTEILFAVGAGAQVTGRDMFSDYPAEAAPVQDIGGSMGEYNLEAIVALQPDLVLAGGINPPELVASLEELGLTVYFLPNPLTLEEMFANLETVGMLTGHEVETAALVESLAARVAAVDQVIPMLSYRPYVYYELDATNPAQPYTAGPGTFVDLLIQRAGGFNIGAELEGEWATISVERLLVADPTIILLGDAAYGETPEKVALRPGWEALTAVRNGQVFPIDDNLVSRPGPRLVDGLEALVELLHPGVLK
jgi:iron complex transport system substrate-binding protein